MWNLCDLIRPLLQSFMHLLQNHGGPNSLTNAGKISLEKTKACKYMSDISNVLPAAVSLIILYLSQIDSYRSKHDFVVSLSVSSISM